MGKSSNICHAESEKRKKHRVVNKLSMRRARQKMTEQDLEERRRKDRERYKRKKEQGKVKSIADVTPRERRRIQKQWKAASQRYRKKKKDAAAIELQTENLVSETPPSTPSVSVQSSRALSGQLRAKQNRRILKQENLALKVKLKLMESRVSKYKSRLLRSKQKLEAMGAKTKNSKFNSVAAVKKRLVQTFFERDEVSKTTAGKKETITRKGQKKQIRFLLDNIYNLYKKFIGESQIIMSYSLFCRYRPFWVLIPNVNKRDTCLCTVHTNAEYIVKALKFGGVIDHQRMIGIVKSICCVGNLQECLTRKCRKCKDLKLKYNNDDLDDTITYEKWVTKKFYCVIKSKHKQVAKTVKENITTTKRKLVQTLIDTLPKYMNHINNIFHQYRAVKQIKNQVTDDWALLHLDFSENYNCKYREEVQSAHFGGSKPQITLHTSVLYHNDDSSKNVSITPYCTLSDNNRHDPVLICAHLLPILEKIKLKVPNLNVIHFTSDGPVTQYRNKSMFFLIAHYIAVILNVDSVIWHYSEAGHGKGAPDGVGGCVKRVADRAVALGKDVSNFDSLLKILKNECQGINILQIDDSKVQDIENLLKQSDSKAFKGTLNVHQVVWNRQHPLLLNANKLSCWLCSPSDLCHHYGLGQISVKKHENLPCTPPVEQDGVDRETNVSPISASLIDINRFPKTHQSFYKTCYPSSASSSNVSTPIKPTPGPSNVSINRNNVVPTHLPHFFDDSSDEDIF